MKRFLPLLLTIAMLLPLLASCGNSQLTIIQEGSCNILYDPETVSRDTLYALTDAIEELTDVSVNATKNGDVENGYILLGNVKIEDYVSPVASLRSNDFFVGIDSGFYLIGGVTEEATLEAIDYFIDYVLPNMTEDLTLTVDSGNNYTAVGSYRVEDISIGGAALSDFSIITSEAPDINEYRTAVLLRESIRNNTGYVLPILTDDEECPTAGQILIGTDLCGTDTLTGENGYAVSVSGKTMKIAAASMLGYEAVQKLLQNRVFGIQNDTPQMGDSFSLTGNGDDLASAPLEIDGDLRLMFSNIHGYPTTDDGPTPVKEASQQLAELYLTYLPDILGTQEFSPGSYNAKLDQMIASEYTAVSVSTGGSYKTYTALFYRSSTVELLKSGYFGFNSLTYNEYDLRGGYSAESLKATAADNSKGVTWGIFRVKATGKLVLVGSTHLWWKGGDINETARRIQLMALREHLAEQAAAFATDNGINAAIPIFVGGDYNTSLNRAGTALSIMGANSLAKSKLTTSTHHGYATFDDVLGIYKDPQYATSTEKSAIDHIYVSDAGSSSVSINRVGILSDLYAHLSSDHNPIYTDISFTAAAPTLSTATP